MKKLEISLEDDLYEEVSFLASMTDTTVEVMVRDYLVEITRNPYETDGTITDTFLKTIELFRRYSETSYSNDNGEKSPASIGSNVRHFLYYWKHDEVIANREFPNDPIFHVGSNQLNRASPGDQIYFIGQENGSMLLLGKLSIDEIVDQATAERVLDRDNLISRDFHGICTADEAFLPCLILIDELLPDLEVITAKAIERIGLPLKPGRFQTMRQLTAESAERLNEYYESEFSGPNDLLERPEEE